MYKITKLILTTALCLSFAPNGMSSANNCCPSTPVKNTCVDTFFYGVSPGAVHIKNENCENGEMVIGRLKGSRGKDITELPMCAAEHTEDKYYKKITVVNDSAGCAEVRLSYRSPIFKDNTRKRTLNPGETTEFKYDKDLPIRSKYIEYNGKEEKANCGQTIHIK